LYSLIGKSYIFSRHLINCIIMGRVTMLRPGCFIFCWTLMVVNRLFTISCTKLGLFNYKKRINRKNSTEINYNTEIAIMIISSEMNDNWTKCLFSACHCWEDRKEILFSNHSIRKRSVESNQYILRMHTIFEFVLSTDMIWMKSIHTSIGLYMDRKIQSKSNERNDDKIYYYFPVLYSSIYSLVLCVHCSFHTSIHPGMKSSQFSSSSFI